MQFSEAIEKFNKMYGLPVAEVPTTSKFDDPDSRLMDFQHILEEEISEIEEIPQLGLAESELDYLTAVADLLGDVIVYCASEMLKFGIPMDETLAIIMQSNFSKLGEDGKPILDARLKVQKGPGYWRPEPKIREMLAKRCKQNPSQLEIF